jgi:hypothetical protein
MDNSFLGDKSIPHDKSDAENNSERESPRERIYQGTRSIIHSFLSRLDPSSEYSFTFGSVLDRPMSYNSITARAIKISDIQRGKFPGLRSFIFKYASPYLIDDDPGYPMPPIRQVWLTDP